MLEAQIERSSWGVLKRIGPEGSSYTPGSPSLLRLGVSEEPVGVEGLVPFEHEVDGTAELMG